MSNKQAANFSTGQAYSIGNLVLYGGVLYEFTSNHAAGAWNDADVAAVDSSLEQDVTRVVAGYNNAEKASAYADTVVMEPDQIEGTRYKFILTDAIDPRI